MAPRKSVIKNPLRGRTASPLGGRTAPTARPAAGSRPSLPGSAWPKGPILPPNLPAVRRSAENAVAGLVDPMWIPVTSSWAAAYRSWRPAMYPSGLVTAFRLDIRFLDGHEHAYQIPPNIFHTWERASSKGKWIHRVLLGDDWTPQNRKSRYPNWPLN